MNTQSYYLLEEESNTNKVGRWPQSEKTDPIIGFEESFELFTSLKNNYDFPESIIGLNGIVLHPNAIVTDFIVPTR